MTADFRPEYLDTVSELCDTCYGDVEDSDVVWEAEYLTRGMKWFHCFGLIRNGKSESVGHEYSLDTGSAETVDPGTMVLTLLDFEANAHIAAYSGPRSGATSILQDIDALWPLQPEIMRISLVGHSASGDNRQIVSATEIVYIGLAAMPPAPSVHLAQTKDDFSKRWYRGRRFIRAAACAAG